MAWLSVFISFLTVLAVARVTRLITEDTITKPLRDRIHAKAQPRTPNPAARPGGRPDPYGGAPRPAPRAWRYLSKLVTCPWCSGFWVSAAATLAYYRMWLGTWPTTDAPTLFSYLVAVFGCSWLTAIAADWLDSPPPARHQVHHGEVNITLNQPTPPTT